MTHRCSTCRYADFPARGANAIGKCQCPPGRYAKLLPYGVVAMPAPIWRNSGETCRRWKREEAA